MICSCNDGISQPFEKCYARLHRAEITVSIDSEIKMFKKITVTL